MVNKKQANFFSGLTKGTFLLAFASLFSDVSTEMLYPVLPIFVTQVLHASPLFVGIIEGVATAIQYTIQGFSGWLADKFQSKKPIALFGYALAACSKPFIGLSTAWQGVLVGRSFDRLGAGIRGAPRDALIAQSADDANKGKAFGLEGIGDNLGAFIGPLIALYLLYTLHIAIRNIFYLAFFPGILALIMVLFVHEKKAAKEGKTHLRFSFASFPKSYWKYMLITALFGIGNSSNSFLILQAQRLGIPLFYTILTYAFFNLVAALSSFPAGSLSDTIGRKKILIGSFVIFAITYAGFGKLQNVLVIVFLFIFYGIFSGIYRAVGKTLAIDGVSPSFRATAIGMYSTVVGVSGFFASFIGGQLWVSLTPSATFYFGTICSVIAIYLSIFLLTDQEKVAS